MSVPLTTVLASDRLYDVRITVCTTVWYGMVYTSMRAVTVTKITLIQQKYKVILRATPDDLRSPEFPLRRREWAVSPFSTCILLSACVFSRRHSFFPRFTFPMKGKYVTVAHTEVKRFQWCSNVSWRRPHFSSFVACVNNALLFPCRFKLKTFYFLIVNDCRSEYN